MQQLNVTPMPLIFSQKRVVLSFSPKSACSHAIIWFLLKENLLPAANYFSHWPHDFRNKVYYNSQVYKQRKQAFAKADPNNWTLLKVTRDPAKRLISQFRHCVRYNVIDTQIQNRAGISMSKDGLSFNDFVKVLKKIPRERPSTSDPHVCAQFQPVWTLPFGRVITINVDDCEVNDVLNLVEKELDMSVTDFETQGTFARIKKIHYAKKEPVVVDAPAEGWENFKLTRQAIKDDEYFPKKELLPHAQKVAAKLFPNDSTQTACSDSEGTIFPRP
ncbi:sulfotransferase family 2 domain-containing protein [Shimia thalassica]|uniref:sulfotransferase family 2 domain-containing protein n=1 Tax=Shimia thalassica TaxID=1715693 RepID=UPI000C0881EF|nr:sulfotransferase family 2 domain-containing protein [Shimia thalassica]MBU2943919.1 sulfotransferase family 2 domain-containing protein [Shimia thalassica]MDO6484076.1 sulfotransferase family 2 domain-containing protein [Shimia thalassica]MDO6505280.1 sulfotransferase family 2 domain-containing protein [Shimia thalassica]MDO6523915.1 sulfotransferase family 2 domain-containing protein [Shimia thalassica]MDP2496305.1 sulfotransferase family 2 domain-containing protein [Shimia thalassica]